MLRDLSIKSDSVYYLYLINMHINFHNHINYYTTIVYQRGKVET